MNFELFRSPSAKVHKCDLIMSF